MIKAKYQKMYTEKYKQDMDFVIIGNHYIGPFVDMDTAQKAVDAINSQCAQKPRTRTEYEKVTESIFDLRDEFERGGLYFKCSEGDWVQAVHESEVVHFLNNCGLYRKVEKEIDWREEVMKYLFENDYHNSRIATDDWLEIKQSFKNDEFLELCRVALRANGEIE